MLTKNLLEVKKRKPNIKPKYREPSEYIELAREIIGAYKKGRKKEDISDEISELETHDEFKFIRGLDKLMERNSVFQQKSEVSPIEIRRRLFRKGPVTDEEELKKVIKEVSNEFEIEPTEVREQMYGDRDKNQVLVKKHDISPKRLIKEYNLSLTQTLLFDAHKLDIRVSGNYQEIFSAIKYFGLMYLVKDDLTISVTGPASIFKKTRKYGTSLAKLVPSVIKSDEWEIEANIETKVGDEKRIYTFNLDSSERELFPKKDVAESYDSKVELDFAKRINSVKENWEVKREPTILRTGKKVMIPDFSFQRDNMKLYLEVIGFWTPDYLEKKIEKINKINTNEKLLLAVNKSLKCKKEDFKRGDKIFFYERKIPLKPIIRELNQMTKEKTKKEKTDLNKKIEEIYRLAREKEDKCIEIDYLSKELDVMKETLKDFLNKNTEGIISDEKYITKKTLNEIKNRINKLENKKLSEVNKILNEYGIAQTVLKEIGYKIDYSSLNPENAEIKKINEQDN
ncbi:MAG: Nuclease of restriction endonuclease-like fold implicated in nucleotide excision repair [Candidatus Methanohalarchaeum thermophilum]|uniref:Nuclease of restriction endonuclease-like fold implicated in nucleotide excision repair n=1 Tax=Methanohalarchaeum thermophilum TaxID=1903181 RepID=A0A1Q6DT31_METT1|nr:MAG: Nuclease of restriction endonuclease-like fold implicated in nucleotide excision repair [Candidatus Methanohalarchaeum thermophilum]